MTFVYQIYPISYYDSNNDGIGDLRGIIQKIPYIKSLGVDYIWLTPIFTSPMNDNGYDIENYYEINSMFGTKEDLIELINVAKKHNLKVMLDMVFNHTSTNHPWFKKFLAGDENYQDFYITKQSKNIPTNWVSKFGGPAWFEYEPQKWYLHLFDKTQADLNWENPKVIAELKKVVRYYIDLGVKGFRFDVINLISKNEFKDDFDGDGRKYYTNGPKVHEYLKEIVKEFANETDFLTVGELSSTDICNAQKFANSKNDELNSVFTFHHLKVDYVESNDKFIYQKPNILLLNKILQTWQEQMQETNSTLANFFNNHDQPRSVSRFIDEKYYLQGSKMLFALQSTLKGITYIYQGEEIGMLNPNFEKKEQYRDVETLNYMNKHNYEQATKGIKQKSRDNSRTPMQWNGNKFAGFSQNTPWIEVASNYKKLNVELQEKDNNSTLSFYRKFIEFCNSDVVLTNGKIKFEPYQEQIISFKRFTNSSSYLCVFSFSDQSCDYFIDGKVIYSNYDIISNKLQPYQFLIIKK